MRPDGRRGCEWRRRGRHRHRAPVNNRSRWTTFNRWHVSSRYCYRRSGTWSCQRHPMLRRRDHFFIVFRGMENQHVSSGSLDARVQQRKQRVVRLPHHRCPLDKFIESCLRLLVYRRHGGRPACLEFLVDALALVHAQHVVGEVEDAEAALLPELVDEGDSSDRKPVAELLRV